MDLANEKNLSKKMDTILFHHNLIRKGLKKKTIDKDPLMKELNPNIHQAMMEIEDNNKEVGTIVQEIQKGFMMKDRLLRPSLVGVSTKTKKAHEETKKDQENKENKDKN